MPFRSAQLTLGNATQFPMKQLRHNECHGGLTDGNSFPDTIQPGKRADWEHESQGIGTGTEGWIKFTMVGSAGDTVLIYWDNPTVGNTFFGFASSSKDNLDPSALFGNSFCGDDLLPPGGFGAPPSQFAFFALSDGIYNDKIVGLIEGDGDGAGVVFPFGGQDRLFPHAWFQIGVCDTKDTSLRTTASCLKTAPSIRALSSNGQLSFRQRLNLPYGVRA